MTEQHPITPPPELVRKWNEETATAPMADQRYIAIQAARWGSDQELEACINWMRSHFHGVPKWADDLRSARRPEPLSLKAQAYAELDRLIALISTEGALAMAEPIRRALDALDD